MDRRSMYQSRRSCGARSASATHDRCLPACKLCRGLDRTRSKPKYLAFATLQYLGDQVKIAADYRMQSPNCKEPTWYAHQVDFLYSAETWNAIFRIFQRPWFQRLWVFQEIQLANEESMFQCGKSQISWDCLRKAMRCLNNKRKEPFPGFTKHFESIVQIAYAMRDRPFINCLSALRKKDCSDARDKIYGLLGLSPLGFSDRISPDYPLPAAETYMNAFLAYVEHYQRLDLLRHTTRVTNSTAGLPSWVPDLSAPA